MSWIPIARFFLCIYLPMAWAQSALATWRYAPFTLFCGLVVSSVLATLLIVLLVWLAIRFSSALLARAWPRVEAWRWAAGAFATVMSVVLGLIIAHWIRSFGVYVSSRAIVGTLALGFAALWFLRPAMLRSGIDTGTGNAWQLLRYPLLLAAVVCVCGTVAGLATSSRSADSPAPRDASAPASAARSLLLISIDTFSASRSSLHGSREETTPFLRSLAPRGVVFDMALSASNFTSPGVASIHTGQYPWTHRIVNQSVSFREQPTTLATTLAAAGYQTAYFNANWWGDPRHTASQAGWHHGEGPFHEIPIPRNRLLCRNPLCDTANVMLIPPFLELYAAYAWVARRLGYMEKVHYPPEVVFDSARDWIAARSDEAAPQFVWVHIFGPHDPYFPPPPYRYSLAPERRFDTVQQLTAPLYKFSNLPPESVRLLESRYQEMLRYVDDSLRKFLTDPAVAAFAAQSVVVITSDHGESFERGYLAHCGPLLTQSLIRIPLIIQSPDIAPGVRVTQPVSQTDIFPTVLEMLGVPTPGTADGISLLPAMQGAALPARPIYSMNLEKAYARGRLSATPWSLAVVDWPWKFVDHSGYPDQRSELYDLGADPGEGRNLAAERPAEVARYSTLLRQALAAHD